MFTSKLYRLVVLVVRSQEQAAPDRTQDIFSLRSSTTPGSASMMIDTTISAIHSISMVKKLFSNF